MPSDKLEGKESIQLESKHGELNATVYSFKSGTSDGEAMGAVSLLHPFAKASGQLPLDPGALNMEAFVRQGEVIEPPVDLDFYSDLYRGDPIVHACVEAKAVNIALQGYRIRPRWELAVLDQSIAPMADQPGGEPEGEALKELREQQRQIQSWFESSMPDNSFPEILDQLVRDKEALGQGYIEFSRGGADDELEGMYLVKGLTIRILKGDNGYIQIRGGRRRVFSKYAVDDDNRKKAALTTGIKEETSADPGVGGRGKNKEILPIVTNWATKKDGFESGLFGIDAHTLKAGEMAAESVNELFCMKKGTTADSLYGDPDTLAALRDVMGAMYAAQFNVSYFENSTVPRMAIIVKGGQLSQEIIDRIEVWLNSQNSIDALNQVLLIDIVERDVELTFENMSVSQLKDAGFLEYRNSCDEHIRIAHRVPQSIIASLLDINRATSAEANWRFLSQVVRPEQRKIEARFNYIFREDMGIEDLVLDLNVPDLIPERERAEIFNIYLSKGVMSINEVRKFFGRPPITGGDRPFIQSVGQGAMLVEFLERANELALGVGEGTVTGGMQTPPNDAPLFQLPTGEKAVRAYLNEEALGTLTTEEQKEMALIGEGLHIPRKVLEKALPKAFPKDE